MTVNAMLKFTKGSFATILASLVISTSAHSQESTNASALSDVYACKNISDSSQRLVCYDSAVGQLETAEKIGDIVTIDKAEIERAKQDTFGLKSSSTPALDILVNRSAPKTSTARVDVKTKTEKKKKKDSQNKRVEAEDFDEVEFVIARTKTFGRDKVRFYFTNGQVWDQVGDYKVRVPRVKDGIPNSANVRKAAFGSFLLRINNKGRAIRVRRNR